MSSSKPVDPFDVEALRAAPPSVASTEHMILKIAVRKPNRGEFFRINTDPALTVDATILEYTEPAEGRQLYYVPPAIRAIVPEDELRPVRLFTCISRYGVLFLWPARLVDGLSRRGGTSWAESALEAADLAMDQWIKLASNIPGAVYEAHKATGDLPDPAWPADLTLRDMLELGFGARVITSKDHPVLQALEGRI